MTNRRDRRSHVLPPSRKVRRQSLAVIVRREHIDLAGDTDLDVMFSLTPQGRRALLEDRRDREVKPW